MVPQEKPRQKAAWTPPWQSILHWIDSEVRHATERYRLPISEREELRQSLCVRVLESFRRFDYLAGAASIETWVRRHAIWGVADYWRHRLRRERRETAVSGDVLDIEDPRVDSPSWGASRSEFYEALRQCLEKLTPHQRERLLRVADAAGSGDSQGTLARQMGISRDTLKDTLSRARVLVRRCLHLKGFSPTAEPPPESGGGTV